MVQTQNKPVISVINYLNSMPFIYGFDKYGIDRYATINKNVPAQIAECLINGSADIGLVPVAALPFLPDHRIVSQYCISAEREVDSVILVADVPIRHIETVYLDPDSRTSVQLVKILAREKWKISPEWLPLHEGDPANKASAVLAIGDKAFQFAARHQYVTDLAREWFDLTGLPFVFAVWAGKRNLPESFLNHFNDSLTLGIEQLESVVKELKSDPRFRKDVDVGHYLTKRINYSFNERKKEAILRFLELAGHHAHKVSLMF
ncbi:MAG: menaquinone biosynthesis protein [Bacteroidetes bacterium]|nr:menaquinone biosynthesis protein [Bacteroidota bacterium]MBU1718326.1 menaquinone biosynthesis protein [Bacteroidota bacterium]